MKEKLVWVATSLMIILLIVTVSCSSSGTVSPTSSPAPSVSEEQANAPTATSAPRQGQGANGTVSKISGNSLTLTTTEGQVSVNIGSDTIIQKTMAGTVSDLIEGRFLSVQGSKDADGAITATSIVIRSENQGMPTAPPTGGLSNPAPFTPPMSGNNTGGTPPMADNRTLPGSLGGGPGNGTNGSIAKVDGNTLTLTSTGGQVTVNIGSDTVIQKTVAGTISDLIEGQSLRVIGSRDANGDITAASIIIQPSDPILKWGWGPDVLPRRWG